MIKIEKEDVFGWESAIRGMRNPMNSWDKSDSWYECKKGDYGHTENNNCYKECIADCKYCLGYNDLKLMKQLRKAGSDHAKYLRMINITCDITAPLYWWKEYDSYKVGTVANSCSTMHKIHDKEFTLDDFSHEHLLNEKYSATELLDVDGFETNILITPKSSMNILMGMLNNYRLMYLRTNDKKWWWQMIQLLPSSYNQKRTVQLNYAVLLNMYNSRKNHKLDEWHDFCDWCEKLPYFKEICLED